MANLNQADFRALILEAVTAQRAKDEGEKQAGQVSKKLLALAKQAQHQAARMKLVKDDKDNIIDLEYPAKPKPTTVDAARTTAKNDFTEACEQAENYIVSEECPTEEAYIQDGEKTVPDTWKQAKSNLRAALELGIPLNQFESESAVRTAKGAINKTRKMRKDHNKAESVRKEAANMPIEGDFPEGTPDDLADAFLAIMGQWSKISDKVNMLEGDQKEIWRTKQTELLDSLTLFTGKMEAFSKEVDSVIEQVTQGRQPVKRKEQEKSGEGEISRGVREERENDSPEAKA